MVQLCARTVPLSSPARITIAPLGGDEGPCPRTVLSSHMRTGGDAGLVADSVGPTAGDAGPVGAEPAAEGRSNASARPAKPAIPAAIQAVSVHPTRHLR